MRLTLGSIKNTISCVVGVPPNDSRVADYVNRAQERLLYKGKWVGTYGRFLVCSSSDCITIPRQIETVEAVAISDKPMEIRSQWFEFLEAGPGIMTSSNSTDCQPVDSGEAVAFDDVTGAGKRLAIYCDLDEKDANGTSKTINLRYYTEAGGYKRSQVGSGYIDGENFPLGQRGVYIYSSSTVAPYGLVGVIKPRTNGVVRLYEHDTVAGTYKALAYYEPDEERPVYRRYRIHGLALKAANMDCGTVSVQVMGKLRFLPVYSDNDFLIIQHADAVRLMVQAIRKEEANVMPEALPYEAKAMELLDDQLKHWRGSGQVQPIAKTSRDVTGSAVPNLI